MFVYMIRHMESGKAYVGQTIFDPNKRLLQHKRMAENGTYKKMYPLYHAIRKYGWEAFDKFVLEPCVSREELDASEDQWITKYNCLAPHGYNLKQGGRSGRHTEESRRKIGEASKNRIWSEESKARASTAAKGRKFSALATRRRAEVMESYVATEETRKKLSDASKGRTNSPEQIAAMTRGRAGACTGENHRSARLTWEVVDAIRSEYAEGQTTHRKLAVRYGVSAVAINNVINMVTWKPENRNGAMGSV